MFDGEKRPSFLRGTNSARRSETTDDQPAAVGAIGQPLEGRRDISSWGKPGLLKIWSRIRVYFAPAWFLFVELEVFTTGVEVYRP